MIDSEKLLAPISPDVPCGVDMEYQGDFIALEIAVKGKPEQQVGATIIPAEEPNWPYIKSQTEALFSRTKDLRIALWLTRASIHTDGLSGLASGLGLIKELMTRYWDQLYPALVDDSDPIVRMNALAMLNDHTAVLFDVRSAYVVRPGKFGRVSIKDILMASGKLPPVAGVPSQQEIEGIIRAANENGDVSVEGVTSAFNSVKQLRVFINEKVGADRAPEMNQLEAMLKVVVQLLNTVIGSVEVGEIPLNSSETNPVADQQGERSKVINQIRSREDASLVLDKVCEFIERTEPANPAPLFIRRAQQLMKKNFAEIIQELAPDSWSQIQKMTGLDKRS